MTPTTAYLDDYWAVVTRHWRLLITTTLIGLLTGLAAYFVAPKTYAATASVLVAPVEADTGPVENGRTTGLVNLDTEAQIATSLEVATIIATKAGTGESPKETADRLTVSVPPNTAVLDLTYSASSADQAQVGAQAAADAYLENRIQAERDFVAAQSAQLETRVKELNRELAALRREGDNPDALARRTVLSSTLASLQEEQQQLQAETINPGRIIQAPPTPEGPVSPKRTVLVASGALLGLLVGLVMAAIRERRNAVVSTSDDLRRAFSHVPTVSLSEDFSGGANSGLRTLALDLVREGGQARFDTVAVVGVGPDSPGEMPQQLVAALNRLGVAGSLSSSSQTSDSSGPTTTVVVADGSAAELDRLEAARLSGATIVAVRLGLVGATQVRALVDAMEQHDIPILAIVGLARADGKSSMGASDPSQ